MDICENKNKLRFKIINLKTSNLNFNSCREIKRFITQK